MPALLGVVLPAALFLFMYWLLGGWRWLRRPGWPRTLRWMGAAAVAAWTLALLHGSFSG